jgi:hypothetical protein
MHARGTNMTGAVSIYQMTLHYEASLLVNWRAQYHNGCIVCDVCSNIAELARNIDYVKMRINESRK